ncbi:hypothetical protein, partial [Anaerobacillus arseniciselenatis]|uniref:hypothetical protein n=1 Tax=Anaerobacillus arseniciselenatis TaxID=85682 RepID=UPI001B80A5AE
SVPTNWHSFTYYKNNVRGRVEKYFFGTSPTAQTVGISIFIEGGNTYDEKNFLYYNTYLLSK